MKKKILLTESELIKIIKRLVEEQIDNTKVVNSKVDSIIKNLPKDTTSSDTKSEDTPSQKVIILISGLYRRKNDYDVNGQAGLLKRGISNANVFAYAWDDRGPSYEKLKEYPNAYVVTFSMGTKFTDEYAKKIGNINHLYVVEPFPGAKTNIMKAVNEYNLPKKNIILSSYNPGAGYNLIPGCSETPKNYSPDIRDHWKALKYVGEIISSAG